jgi:small subunit ribosomal protein S13
LPKKKRVFFVGMGFCQAVELRPGAALGEQAMPKILGIDIPGKKRIEYSLCYIYGIGLFRAKVIVKKANVDPNKRADSLTAEEMARITGVLQDGYMLEGDLRRDVSQNVRRLISIQSYRGVRHRKGLPVRGQRTHTNARTRKGVRKTVGVVRVKETRAEMLKSDKE